MKGNGWVQKGVMKEWNKRDEKGKEMGNWRAEEEGVRWGGGTWRNKSEESKAR